MDEEIQLINGNKKFSYCRNIIIGEGRTSYVFRGKYDGRNVAVKRIIIGSDRDSADLSSRDEIKILSELQHAHIVKFLFSEDYRTCSSIIRYLVFELCSTDLRKFVSPESEYRANGGRVLTVESDQIKVILQLSEALQFIHSKKIIHHDIKPENILVSNNGSSVNMKWTDFGHSKQINNGSDSMSGFRGTKFWMAPEIIHFNEIESTALCFRKIDIFSAGCVFFFFLTNGVHPFGDEKKDESNLEQNIIDENMINESVLNNGHRAKRTVLKMMVKNVENRPELEEVISELEEISEIRMEL